MIVCIIANKIPLSFNEDGFGIVTDRPGGNNVFDSVYRRKSSASVRQHTYAFLDCFEGEGELPYR